MGQRTVTALLLPTWRIVFWDSTKGPWVQKSHAEHHPQRCGWSPSLSPELGRHGVQIEVKLEVPDQSLSY